MQPLLRSERLVFRRVALSDVADLVILNADQDVMRFIDWQPPSPEEVTAEVKELVSAYNRYPDHGRYVAENSKGEFLGWFGLRVTSSGPRIPELGFRLRRLSWGQGLATEGSRALIDHAFQHTGALKVFAETMSVNAASRRVLEKCGMRHVRTFQGRFDDPLPDTEFGEVVYEIALEDWQDRRATS